MVLSPTCAVVMSRSSDTVSYTHLDVYKRQLCHLLDEAADADDEELESAFGRIEKQLESASR